MNDIAITSNNSVKAAVTSEQKALVKSVIFPEANDAELELFFYECGRRGVHPLDRLIHPVKRNDSDSGTKRVTFQCGIDYFRAAAQETGEYDGQDEPEFGDVDPQGFPEWAKVAVYRKGTDRPFIGIARWKEYYPGEKMGFMWRKMPHAQLAKCAEALAFRKAFPLKLAGLYAEEEMHQAIDVGAGSVPLKETVKEKPPVSLPEGTPKQAPEAEKRTPQEQLAAELEAYEPDWVKRGVLLKSLSIFGQKGKEKWMNLERIKETSDKWCLKVLENLRKLPPKPGQEPSGETEACTGDPKTCLSAQWASEGNLICLDTGKPCP